MRNSIAVIKSSVIASCMLAASALAQNQPAGNVPELESDQLVDEGFVQAEILAADYDDRTLTVRFDSNNETAKVIVPEDAEIFRTFPNELERRIELSELNAGDQIEIRAFELEGVIRLRIVGGVS